MMDVGSKAGYYTSKSPKLHLYEVGQRLTGESTLDLGCWGSGCCPLNENSGDC
jgi:hypothetical protein